MRRVMAQGTFDIIHPGHLHYFSESAALGDELCVVVARDSRMRRRKDLFFDEESRRTIVDALEMVDRAVLGSTGSIYESVDRIEPDVITLGYDQGFDEAELEADLAEEGFPDVEVVRVSKYPGDGPSSSSEIKARIKERYGAGVFTSVVDQDAA